MLAQLFEHPFRIRQLLEGPGGQLLGEFARELCRTGYKRTVAGCISGELPISYIGKVSVSPPTSRQARISLTLFSRGLLRTATRNDFSSSHRCL
jgi:hypothetical protein